MKRPKISNALTVSQGQYGKFIAYADHLEEEIERLKAERVELVTTFIRWSGLDTAEDADELADEFLEQFKIEKS